MSSGGAVISGGAVMSGGALVLAGRRLDAAHPAVMAIVNRTRDSFYDGGATFASDAALARVEQAIEQGADIVDIGGVKAGPGEDVDVAEEIRRTAGFVATVRERFPSVLVSVDTWRHEVGREVAQAGAHLINDAWGGYDPRLAEVAAQFGLGLVCTHTGGLAPRTAPHRVQYADLVTEVLADLEGLAARAEAAGVKRDRILIDPGHDFNKNTWHSLELTRQLSRLVDTGRPVLVALSNKDFVGETLNRPVDQRLAGTLAATAIAAWQGAAVFRVHQVRETRDVLDMVATLRGDRPPAAVVRGLA